MAQYVTMIAVGKWENRASLTYVPVNERINGRRYNAFGIANNAAADPLVVRRPYRMEEDGSVTYVCYDDDANANVPIYKTAEV